VRERFMLVGEGSTINFIPVLMSIQIPPPNEISFSQKDILGITDKPGKWWIVSKVDGTTTGVAPFPPSLLNI
jgi:hypothetical protein